MQIEQFTYPEEMNVLPAILWQYQNSPNISGLIQAKQSWLDVNFIEFWNGYTTGIFDLTSADIALFGICVWCIILDIPLYIPLGGDASGKPLWGFNAYTTPPTLINTYKNFGDTIIANPGSGNFSTDGAAYVLTLAEQQFVLRLAYFDLCNLGDIIDINAFLNHLCATSNIGFTGAIYIVDNLDMTVSYTFTTADFPAALLGVITDLKLLPRPVGVEIV